MAKIKSTNKLTQSVIRSLTLEEIRVLTCDCAEIVLPIYENKFPKDKRPLLAIEAIRDHLCGYINNDVLKIKQEAVQDAEMVRLSSYYGKPEFNDYKAANSAWSAILSAINTSIESSRNYNIDDFAQCKITDDRFEEIKKEAVEKAYEFAENCIDEVEKAAKSDTKILHQLEDYLKRYQDNASVRISKN